MNEPIAADTAARAAAVAGRDALAQASLARLATFLPVALAAPAAWRPGLGAWFGAIGLMLLLAMLLREWLFRARRDPASAPDAAQRERMVRLHLAAGALAGAAAGALLWLSLSLPADARTAWVACCVLFGCMGAAQWRSLRLRNFLCYALPALAVPSSALLVWGGETPARVAGVLGLGTFAGLTMYARWSMGWMRSRVALQQQAGAAQAESERTQRRLELALQHSESGFALYDADDRLVIANTAYARLIGLDPAWCRPGMPYRELLQRWVAANGLDAEAGERFVREQLQRHRADGSRVELPMAEGRWVRVVKHVTPEGEVVAVLTDLSAERDRAREVAEAHAHAAATMARLEASIDAHRDAFSIWTAEGRLVEGNEAFRALFHHVPAATTPGSPWRDAILQFYAVTRPYPEDSPQYRERYALLMRFIEQPGFSEEIKVHPGRWLRLSSARAPTGDIVIVATDVTLLKQHAIDLAAARDEAARAARLVQDSIDATDEALAIWDAQGRLKVANRAYRELLGGVPVTVQAGIAYADVLDAQFETVRRHYPDASFWPERRRQLIGLVMNPPGTLTIRVWPGRWRRMTSRRTAQGDTCVTITDVTELTEARDAAAQSLQLLQESIEALDIGISIWSADGRLKLRNQAFVDFARNVASASRPGATFTEVIDEFYALVAPNLPDPSVWPPRRALLLDMMANPGRTEVIGMHPDRWRSISTRRTALGDTVFTFTDVTEVKAREQEAHAARDAAARSVQLLQESIDAIDAGFSIWAPDGTLKVCNQAYRGLIGTLPVAIEPGVRFTDLIDLQVEHFFAKTADLSFWPERRARLLQLLQHPPGETTVKIWSGRWRTLTTSRNSQGDTVMVTVDVTELKQQALELAAARDAAEAADRAKSSFLATMSHEIRTPMNGVLGMLEVLEHQGLNAEQRESLDVAQDSARTLLHLIDEVLDFSKIEAGALHLEAAEFSLSALVEAVVQSFRRAARAKRLVLASVLDPGSSDLLVGDTTRVRQILNNLVGNALKFTDRGRVEVRARTRPLGEGEVELTLEVMDTGIGISAEQAEGLFQPFAQADGSITRRFGGTGLGLSIVSRLAEAMGGGIDLDSTPGRGSTFTVRLRLQTAPADSALRLVEAAPAPAPATPAAAAPVRGHVLVVDDHPTNRALLQRQLTLLGITSAQAGDGDEAAQVLAREAFDLVLCDVHMPRVDGYEFTRRLRQAGARTPVVAVTANVMQGEAERCLAAGMDGYLGKPVSLAQLRSTLARWLPLEGAAAPEAAGAAATPADYDRARLVDLFGDDAGAIAAVLEDFLHSAHDELERAGAALRWGDLAALAVCGHRLKGAAVNVGAQRLAAAAAALEAAGRAGQGADAQARLGECVAALRAAQAGMRR